MLFKLRVALGPHYDTSIPNVIPAVRIPDIAPVAEQACGGCLPARLHSCCTAVQVAQALTVGQGQARHSMCQQAVVQPRA